MYQQCGSECINNEGFDLSPCIITKRVIPYISIHHRDLVPRLAPIHPMMKSPAVFLPDSTIDDMLAPARTTTGPHYQRRESG